ncbi:MAG: TonB-dependent receptor [Acidobacteriota bacterium]
MRQVFLRLFGHTCVLGSLLFLANPALAQTLASGGAIEGTVRDETGAVLPGATVTVLNEETGTSRTTATDGAGVYRAPLLPVGTYEVSAVLDGFQTVRRPHLELGVGQQLTVDLTLGLAGVEASIEVTAQPPILEQERTHQASTVNAVAVSNLPVNGRNFIDFVLTTPGVTRDVRAGDISFAGQRGTLNSLIIDGADNNNSFFGQTLGRTGSGRAPYQFSQETVQEFQVNTNAYSVEYGHAGGAVVNVVTKSGTNDTQGSLFWFYRDESLNANSFANKLARPQRPKSIYHYDQFGGSLGGPIQPGKAFYFIAYEGQRNDIPNDIDLDRNLAGLTIPNDPGTQAGLQKLRSKAGSWQRGQDQDVLFARADWQPTEEHRLTLRYNHQDFTGRNFENGGVTNSEEHTGDSLVKTRTLNSSFSSVLGARTFNEVRAQYAEDREPGLANSDVPEATVLQGGRVILTVGRNFFSPRGNELERWQLADTLTLVRGNHTWKAGFDLIEDKNENFFPGNFSGAYTFNSISSFNRGIPDGPGESYVQAFPGPGTTGPVTFPDFFETAVYLQDQWELRPALTMTFGLRYDRQDIARPEVHNPDPQLAAAGIDTSFLEVDDDNIGPRLGFAWTMSPRTIFRGGYGLFYGRTPTIMVATAHSNNGVNVQTVTFTGSQVPVYPNVFPTLPPGATLPKPTIYVFDRDYENPEVHQASLGLEHAFNDSLALAMGLLHVRARKLQRATDINLFAPVPTAIPVQGGGTVTVDQFPTARPFVNFARIIEFQSTAESEYTGLTLELRRRLSDGFQASLAYTLGKVEDNVPDATAVVPGSTDDAKFASNPFDFDDDLTVGNNDQRHRLVFSGSWFPGQDRTRPAGGWRNSLLGGWSLSWIATAQTGQPYSKTVTNDLNRDGNTRNDIVPGSRNSERLPASYTLDLRLVKAFHVGGYDFELIGEGFNVFDSDNINVQRTVYYNYNPAANLLIPQATFGDDVSAADNRIVQLALRFRF